MHIKRIALGAVASRGSTVTAPALVKLAGSAEEDFLGRHVDQVRRKTQTRAKFIRNAAVPTLLGGLSAASDADFVAAAGILQQLLATAMSRATTPSDGVTALIHARDAPTGPDHFTVLKLDSNVEAAQRDISKGIVNLTVLQELLPTPRDLQKGLSWPDKRSNSDALLVDTNAASAQYFHNAYQVQVSPKSVEAETALRALIAANVPTKDISRALQDASQLDGTSDQVLTTLAQQHPSLTSAAQQAAADTRPAGVVRKNMVASRPVVWKADGVELYVPADRASDVQVTPDPGGGFVLSIRVSSMPQPGV